MAKFVLEGVRDTEGVFYGVGGSFRESRMRLLHRTVDLLQRAVLPSSLSEGARERKSVSGARVGVHILQYQLYAVCVIQLYCGVASFLCVGVN